MRARRFGLTPTVARNAAPGGVASTTRVMPVHRSILAAPPADHVDRMTHARVDAIGVDGAENRALHHRNGHRHVIGRAPNVFERGRHLGQDVGDANGQP